MTVQLTEWNKITGMTKPVTTKQEMAQYIRQSIYLFYHKIVKDDSHSLLTLDDMILAIIEHEAFKHQDLGFYFKWMNARPLQLRKDLYLNTVAIFIYNYINSNKVQIEDYDSLIQAEPYYFIKSEYFTLELFSKYYYCEYINDDIKKLMLERIKDL